MHINIIVAMQMNRTRKNIFLIVDLLPIDPLKCQIDKLVSSDMLQTNEGRKALSLSLTLAVTY